MMSGVRDMRRSKSILVTLFFGGLFSQLSFSDEGAKPPPIPQARVAGGAGLALDSSLSLDRVRSEPRREELPVPGKQPGWLKNIILAVLENHPEIRQYEADARSVDFRRRAAEKQYQPSVRVVSQYGKDHKTLDLQGTQSTRQLTPRNLQLSVTTPLYDSAIGANVKREDALAIAADWNAISVKEQYMLRTLESLLELWKSHRLVELARANLQAHRRYVSQVKEIARVDLGRAADLSTAQARVALAESVMANRLGRLELLRSQWQQTTRLHWTVVKDVVGMTSLESIPLPGLANNLDQVVSMALANSAQLAKVSAEVDAARRGVDAAKAQFKPSVYTEVRAWRGDNLDGIDAKQDGYYYGLNFDWKLPWNGMRESSVNSAMETVNSAMNAKEKIELDLTGRIETEWYNRVAARAALKSYVAYETSAKKVLESVQSQFQIGRRSLLDMLNSESELFTARSNVVTAEADHLIASWRLQALQGKIAMEFGL